jgi:Tfp pilus assembly protein PilO
MRPTWRKKYLRYKSFFLNVSEHYRARKDIRAYLEILLSLATVSIFAIFALRPTLLTIAELIGEIETKKETVIKMDAKIQNLTKAQTLYDIERRRVQLLETTIPRNPTPENLVRQLEAVAGKNAATILNMSIGEAVLLGQEKSQQKSELESLPGGAGELLLSVSATSDYNSLSNYLSDIESLRRPIKIDKLSFTSSETETGKILILLMQGRVPYLRQTNQETAK